MLLFFEDDWNIDRRSNSPFEIRCCTEQALDLKYCIGNGSAGYFMAEEGELSQERLDEYAALEEAERASQNALIPQSRVFRAVNSAVMFFAKTVYTQLGMARERWVSTTIPHELQSIAGGSVMPWLFESALVDEGVFESVQVLNSAVEDWLRTR